MKGLSIFFIATIYTNLCISQGLTQNADGQSSVLFRGSNISLDLQKTELAFELNNLNKVIGENSHGIFGLGISGENAEGISNFFSEGYLTPSSKANIFAGWSISNGIVPEIESRKIELSKKVLNIEKESLGKLHKQMPAIIKANTIDDSQKELQKILLEALEDKVSFNGLRALLKEVGEDSEKVKTAKKIILRETEKRDSVMNVKIDKINTTLKKLDEQVANKHYFQLMLFGIGGIQASEFKRCLDIDTINFSNTFVNENFRGGSGGVGVNIQYGSIILGANYQYLETNNFNLLTKKEYTLRDSYVSGTQTLISEKKITAYTGSYGKLKIQNLNLDLLVNVNLDKEGTNHILINPYFRSFLNSSDSKLLPNSMNGGVGLYFFKSNGKFMGGVYSELTDIKNNYEKAKPISEQNLRDPIKRISFGIITKFSITSLLNLF